LKPNAKFCGKCGETVKLEVPQVQQPLEIGETCKSCGAMVAPGKKFCTACGAPVLLPTPVIHQPPVSQSPVSGGPVSQPQWLVPPVKMRKKKAWIISGLLVVLLAGIAGAAWFYMKEGNTGSIEEEIIWPEYTVHPVVNGTTTVETKEITVSAGNDASIVLSDSCSVLIPGLKSDAKVVLTKEINNIKPGLPGIETSGYMLTLTVEGTDFIQSSMPVITIPRSQVGEINPSTINILRISDVMSTDGRVINNRSQCLPVTVDKAGNYTAIDYLFPYTAPLPASANTQTGDIFERIAKTLIPTASAQDGYHESFAEIAKVRYSIITFQGNVNWEKNPRLVQMIADRSTGHFRHPASAPDRLKRSRPVANVVVFVHGHNEDEKGGYVESMTKDLWEFSYKRDLWNYMYKYYNDVTEKAAAGIAENKEDCTLFYEFIYPSYRPIFTPVPNTKTKSKIVPLRTLGEDFGEAINKEFLKGNPQIAEMIKNKTPFNLFIVTHSMGGLVARAGIRYFEDEVLQNFRQLITWGSPHQGSPLSTLRYIASAGFNLLYDGLVVKNEGSFLEEMMEGYVMHTPGSFDLRWTNGSRGATKPFNFDKLFIANSKMEDKSEYSLISGSAFYNDNLKKFNDTEQYADKYTFFTGSTSKKAKLEQYGILNKALYFNNGATEIEKGAYLISLFVADDAYMANDGASPVYGQGGYGLSPRPKTVDMGDMDHEEFYGSRGYETAEKTFEIMKSTAKCDCPSIADYKMDKNNITAKLVIPSDPNPGKRIKKIEAILTNIKTKEIVETSTDFSFKDPKGVFTGTLSAGVKENETDLELLLKITTKEGSVVEYKTAPNAKKLITDFTFTSVKVERLYGSTKRLQPWDLKWSLREQNDIGVSILDGQLTGELYLNQIKLKKLSWQGNNFEQEQEMILPNRYNESVKYIYTYKVQGVLKTTYPYSVSGEYKLTILNSYAKAEDNLVEERSISFKDVPFTSDNGETVTFSINVKNDAIRKYILDNTVIIKGANNDGWIEKIDWSKGAKITIEMNRYTW